MGFQPMALLFCVSSCAIAHVCDWIVTATATATSHRETIIPNPLPFLLLTPGFVSTNIHMHMLLFCAHLSEAAITVFRPHRTQASINRPATG